MWCWNVIANLFCLHWCDNYAVESSVCVAKLHIFTNIWFLSTNLRTWNVQFLSFCYVMIAKCRQNNKQCIYGLWASYQIRKIAGCACARNAGNVFPHCRFQRKPLVSDPGMHHGTCVTHVPWCMSGSLTCGDGENVPGIPGACAPAILRIWQEAHSQVNSDCALYF